MSPRMKPDGSVKVTNIGTTRNPVLVAAPNTPLEDMMAATPEQQPAKINWDEFFDTLQERALEHSGSPKKELLWRLNTRLQGEDPGEPVNWRGARGLVRHA